MNVIICLDDNKGMLFNNRRQSRDKALLTDIFRDLKGEKLFVTPFSEKLMADYSDSISVCEDASVIGEGQWFFCENIDLTPFCNNIEKIIVYKWNRVYPADFYCEIDLGAFNIVSEGEFPGSSHEKITKIVYSR
jgi:hypothetical protein